MGLREYGCADVWWIGVQVWVCECMVICVRGCMGVWMYSVYDCVGYGYGGMGGSMGMWVSRLEMGGRVNSMIMHIVWIRVWVRYGEW